MPGKTLGGLEVMQGYGMDADGAAPVGACFI